MAYNKQDSTFSFFNNNNNNAGSQDDDNNNDKYKNLCFVPIPETSDEAEVDELSEEFSFVAITYTVFGVDNDDDYDEVDDEDFTMPNIVEEYDEPDQDAIALEHAPLANGAGPNGPIEDD